MKKLILLYLLFLPMALETPLYRDVTYFCLFLFGLFWTFKNAKLKPHLVKNRSLPKRPVDQINLTFFKQLLRNHSDEFLMLARDLIQTEGAEEKNVLWFLLEGLEDSELKALYEKSDNRMRSALNFFVKNYHSNSSQKRNWNIQAWVKEHYLISSTNEAASRVEVLKIYVKASKDHIVEVFEEDFKMAAVAIKLIKGELIASTVNQISTTNYVKAIDYSQGELKANDCERFIKCFSINTKMEIKSSQQQDQINQYIQLLKSALPRNQEALVQAIIAKSGSTNAQRILTKLLPMPVFIKLPNQYIQESANCLNERERFILLSDLPVKDLEVMIEVLCGPNFENQKDLRRNIKNVSGFLPSEGLRVFKKIQSAAIKKINSDEFGNQVLKDTVSKMFLKVNENYSHQTNH